MAKRSGPSISVKMILTSTLLVLLTVVGFGVLNVLNIRGVYDESTQKRINVFREGIKSKAEANTQLIAASLIEFLAAGQDSSIQLVIDYIGKRDAGLRLVYVLDARKQVITYCRTENAQGCDHTAYPGTPDQHLDVRDDEQTWKQALATWGSQKVATASFDIVEDGKKVAVYAYPVFYSEEPTAETALADDPGDNRRGYVVMAYDLSPIEAFAKDARKEKDEASYKAAVKTGVVGALFVLIGTLLAIFQGLQISKPLKLLAWKADQIARGDLEARVEVRSTDEIGILGENFNFMADQIVVLLHQTAEKAHMEKELEVARTIQETLVPPNDPVTKGPFTLAGYFQPASQCGGDWWTWHEMVGDKVLVVVGDVTGHGVPSAMITAAAKAACDVARSQYNDDVSVSTLLEIMNYAIFESAKRKFVMTCFASIVDVKKRTITYANAGHNFPYLYRTGEDGKGEFGSLMIRGNRLGDLKESKYEEKVTELLPGDILVWYTDGIVECENAPGEEYGEKRFRASVRRAAALDAGEMRDAIVSDANAFFGETLRKDDITLVIGKIS
ncbi:MAG: SpoIIE family protein phosphatase [Kofleriaceae bacterium]|nr:SpoIIE family protein phosphatase [Myxococcales bacterium]MCB9563067.1 SpoIIE family protein phosphatase [Kofleriaceae bacterium]